MTLTQLQTACNQFINVQPISLLKEANSLTQSLVACQTKTKSIVNIPLSNIPKKTLRQLERSKKRTHKLFNRKNLIRLSNNVLQHLIGLTEKLQALTLRLGYQYFKQKLNLNISQANMVLDYLQSEGLITKSVRFCGKDNHLSDYKTAFWSMCITLNEVKIKSTIRLSNRSVN